MFEINLVINSFVRKKKEGWKGRVKFEFKIVNLEIDGEKNRQIFVIEDGLFLIVFFVNQDKERRFYLVKLDIDRYYNEFEVSWYSLCFENDNFKVVVKNIQLYND